MIYSTMRLRSGTVKCSRHVPRIDELGADVLKLIVTFVIAPEKVLITGCMDGEVRAVHLETMCHTVLNLTNLMRACKAFLTVVDVGVWFDLMEHFVPRSRKIAYNVEFQDDAFARLERKALVVWRRRMNYGMPTWAVPTRRVRFLFHEMEAGRRIRYDVSMCIRLWFQAYMHDKVTATECANLYGLRRADRAGLKSESKSVKNSRWMCKLYFTNQVATLARAKHGAHGANVSEVALRAACNALGVPSTGNKRKLLDRLNLHVAALLNA
jgi:hypothetical protein